MQSRLHAVSSFAPGMNLVPFGARGRGSMKLSDILSPDLEHHRTPVSLAANIEPSSKDLGTPSTHINPILASSHNQILKAPLITHHYIDVDAIMSSPPSPRRKISIPASVTALPMRPKQDFTKASPESLRIRLPARPRSLPSVASTLTTSSIQPVYGV